MQLADFADKKALLVMFVCAHCPYVVHVRPELTRLANDYAGQSDLQDVPLPDNVVLEGDYQDRRLVYIADMNDVDAKKPAIEQVVKALVTFMAQP